jgi:hypothetical protein
MQLLVLSELLWTSLLLCVEEGWAKAVRLKMLMTTLLRRRTTVRNGDDPTIKNGEEGVRSVRNHKDLLSEEEGHRTAHRRRQIG